MGDLEPEDLGHVYGAGGEGRKGGGRDDKGGGRARTRARG